MLRPLLRAARDGPANYIHNIKQQPNAYNVLAGATIVRECVCVCVSVDPTRGGATGPVWSCCNVIGE